MDDATIAMNEIKTLEDRRYRAMLDADVDGLNALCSDDLIYTHSKGDHDDKQSYLHKVGSRHFTYLEIKHPADRILVIHGAALVTGRMTAKVSVVDMGNRACRQSLSGGLGARAWRLEIRCLPADANHQQLTSVSRTFDEELEATTDVEDQKRAFDPRPRQVCLSRHRDQKATSRDI